MLIEGLTLKIELTAARLRELLHYDPRIGHFTWRIERRCGRGRVFARVGELAGSVDRQTGYMRICIDYVKYHGHRLAWLYVTEAWPNDDIDHIDGDRANNSFGNLRDVSHSANLQNRRRANVNSRSGILGVRRVPSGRWQACVSLPGGQRRHLGTFDTESEAQATHVAAKRRLHPGCTL